MTVPPSLGKLWVGWPISAQLTEALQLPVSPNGAQTSSPFTATSASSPLLGEPGFVIPEEQLPRANHVVRVTAFVEENQIASRVVNVPTCKLTAISPLIRESVYFYTGPGVGQVCACTYIQPHCLWTTAVCVGSPVLSDCRSPRLLTLHHVHS